MIEPVEVKLLERTVITKVHPPRMLEDLHAETIITKDISPEFIEKTEKKHWQEPTKIMLDSTIKSIDLTKNGLDNYSLLDLLGKGSYANVYLARALSENNKQFAIKIFDGEKKSQSIKEEIQILKKICHP